MPATRSRRPAATPIVVLPPSTWREIAGRAATLGLTAELSADGAELRLVADLSDPRGRPDRGLSDAPAGRAGARRVRPDPRPDRRRSRRVILGVFGGTLSDILGAIAAAIDAATGG